MVPRVLFLNPWDRFIGPNRYLLEMLRHVPDLARQAIVAFDRLNGAREEYESLGCRVIVCPEIAQVRGDLSTADSLKLLRSHTMGLIKVIELVRNVRPDVVVSNTEQLWVGGLASRFLGVPHVKIFHAMSFAYRFEKRLHLMRAYLRIFTFESDRVVAVSDTLRKALLAGGLNGSKVFTLCNPIPVRKLKVDSTKPLPADLEAGLKNHYPILVNAGVIFPRKGQDQLIEGIGRVREVFPKVLCLIAGRVGENSGLEDTGRFFEVLQDQIQRLDLTAHVLFLGEIDYLPSLLACADFYIHTSRTESFGRVIAESLVCGTPVIAYNVGAIAEVAGPGAVLVRAGDVGALTSAVLELTRDPQRRKKLAEEGGRRIERFYDSRIQAEKFGNLLTAEAMRRRR